jgi:hypothetical protein
MAKRPIFIPTPDGPDFVRTASAELHWSPGFAVVQKKKNIQALHEAAARMGYEPILEISTKSDEKLGRHLSAFHLKVTSSHGPIALESAFQGSKVFERGGPFQDLYEADARTAKRDPRLRTSGPLIAFDFDGFRFLNEPKTAFYDWLYITSIFEHRAWLRSRLTKFAGFTDIEFNPERSLNCQARSCALFVSLMVTGLLDAAMQSPAAFISTITSRGPGESNQPLIQAPSLADTFPRLSQLKTAVPDPTHPDAYFQHFEERLAESEHIRNQFLRVERTLEALDEDAWHDMLQRAAPQTMQRHPTRGWESLFNTLNESKAFAYLRSLGCSEIAFIGVGKMKTPDLRAVLGGHLVLCEVKTINVSGEEAERRDRIHRGEIVGTSVPISVTLQMLDKVTATVTHAIEQLDHEDPQRIARRIVFTVLHFDDWVGDYQTEYIAQLDAHLEAKPVQGAELVFCPASNLFERHFAMRSATIAEL